VRYIANKLTSNPLASATIGDFLNNKHHPPFGNILPKERTTYSQYPIPITKKSHITRLD
jgi:hypothetical protein